MKPLIGQQTLQMLPKHQNLKEKLDVILYKDIVSRYCLETLQKESHKLHAELLYFATSEMLFLIGEEISCFCKTDVLMLQTALQPFVLGRSFISYSLLEYSVTISHNLDFSPDACQAISFDAKGEE